MYNVSFFGLKENLEYGRQAIDAVKKDFPNGFKSNSYYDVFEKNKDPEVGCELGILISKTRERIDDNKRHGMGKFEATAEAVKRYGCANCGEQAVLINKKLSEQGVKNKIIIMDIRSNSTNYSDNGHTFCVIDDKDIDAREPRNWSDNAVIVDMWSNTVCQAKEGIKYFYELFKPNKRTQYVCFYEDFFV